MEFEWLVALAYPRAVAVHPNFLARSTRTGVAKLASEVLGDSHYERANHDEGTPVPGEDFADQCISALREPQKASATAPLEAYLSDDGADLGRRACAGILLIAT